MFSAAFFMSSEKHPIVWKLKYATKIAWIVAIYWLGTQPDSKQSHKIDIKHVQTVSYHREMLSLSLRSAML